MKRISTRNSHIEHIKPESRCRADKPESDLDYENLVACFPVDGMKRKYRYGAQLKNDWWDDGGAEFISPLHLSCETRLRFGLDGSISAVKDHSGARTTIRVLGLDHQSLTDERKLAIDEFLFGENGDKPLSQAKAASAKDMLLRADGDGRFREYCIALLHAVETHSDKLQRKARKRRYKNRQN